MDQLHTSAAPTPAAKPQAEASPQPASKSASQPATAPAAPASQPTAPDPAAPMPQPASPAPQPASSSRPKPNVKVQVGTPLTAKGALNQEEKADEKKARKGALFMVVIFAVYMAWIVLTGQLGDFSTALAKADYAWLAGGLALMGLRLVFGTLAYVFAAYIDPTSPVGVRDCVSVEANGVLFGNLTPMATGAIPAQIYRLTRTGLDVGGAGAYQFTRFIMYQAGEVIVAAVLLLLRFDFFLEHYGNLVFLNIVVFTIQTLQAAGLLAVCLMPRLVMRVGNFGLRFAKRHRLVKEAKAAELHDLINGQVMHFATIFKQSIRHTGSMLLSWLVTVGMMVCFYSVPWFVLKALGGDADFLTCLAAGSMVQMIGNSVPLPGGTGGNEAGFAFFFGPIFGANAMGGFVIWRIITFFIPTAAALPLTALHSNHTRSIYVRWNAFVRRRIHPARARVAEARLHRHRHKRF